VTDDDFAPAMPESGQRRLEQLDRLVDSGQVTVEEATALRTATNAEDYEAAVVRIRSRHARARLELAVEGGQMTQAEADANLEQIQNGEHPRGLRAQLRKITSKDH
jgi:hypothetical protein